MAKQFTIEDLVYKTVGSLTWYGEPNHDHEVEENMKTYDELLTSLVGKYYNLVMLHSDYRGSAKVLSKLAYETLRELKPIIDECLENYEKGENKCIK